MREFLNRLKRGEKFELSYLLETADPNQSYAEKALWMERLLDWIRYAEGSETTRIKFFFQRIDHHPEWRTKSADVVASVLAEGPAVKLFAETGVPSWTSINKEFMSRMIKVFIPTYTDQPTSLKHVLEQVFYDGHDDEWLRQLPAEQRKELMQWVREGLERRPGTGGFLLREMLDACLILSIKSAAITVRSDFWMRSPNPDDVLHNPLLKLEESFIKIRRIDHPLSDDEIREYELLIRSSLKEAEKLARFVKNHLQKHGVSVDLVYQRDRLKLYLERISLLVDGAFSILKHTADRETIFAKIFVALVRGNNYERDFGFLVRKNVGLVSRKVIDFTGHTGTSFIAQTPREYNKMFWLAAGGGFLTAFTVMIKYAVQLEGWPLFVEMFYAFLNYAISFSVMHFLHFKLATKQPSMTAAALASKIGEGYSNSDDELVEEFAKIARSQFSAVLGNIIAVIPTALVLDWLWSLSKGHNYLTENQAHHVIQSIHPFHTGTVIYAAMTGVILWFSGLTSGWVENAFVFYEVPELIRTHKVLRKLMGPEKTLKLSKALLKNVSGLTAAISLGFYLAAWPILGKFFGLPFDIRHITLTTGSVTMAINSIGVSALNAIDWVTIAVAISLIGLCNFGVSFALALWIAIRARDLKGSRTRSIFKKSLHALLKNPFRFMFPGRSMAIPNVSGP